MKNQSDRIKVMTFFPPSLATTHTTSSKFDNYIWRHQHLIITFLLTYNYEIFIFRLNKMITYFIRILEVWYFEREIKMFLAQNGVKNVRLERIWKLDNDWWHFQSTLRLLYFYIVTDGTQINQLENCGLPSFYYQTNLFSKHCIHLSFTTASHPYLLPQPPKFLLAKIVDC